MSDAVRHAVLKHLINVSAEVEVQLRHDIDGGAPILVMLAKARRRAAAAIVAFMDVPAEDADQIRKLQNDFKVYGMYVADIGEIIKAGRSADEELSQMERADLEEAIIDEAGPESTDQPADEEE